MDEEPTAEAVPPPAEEVPSSSMLHRIQHDDLLSQFLDDEFEAASFLSTVIASHSTGAVVEKLREGTHAMDKDITEEVMARHQELLAHVRNIQDLERVLVGVRDKVRSLEESVARMKADVAAPYRVMVARVAQLERLQGATELLRHMLRFLYLTRKLGAQSAHPHQLAKAAQSLHELEALQSTVNFSGIGVVAAQQAWIARMGADMRARADALLWNGMSQHNMMDIGNALQVFCTLDVLVGKVHGALGTLQQDIVRAIRSTLTVAHLQRAVSGAGGAAGAAAAAVAAAPDGVASLLQPLLERLHAAVLSVAHLQHVLAKKRIPGTYVSFLDTVLRAQTKNSDRTLVCTFWTRMSGLVAKHVRECASDTSAVRSKLVQGYPAMAALFHSFYARLVTACESMGVARADVGSSTLFGALQPVQHEFLSHVFILLSEPVHLMFSATRPPTAADVKNLVAAIGKEVAAATQHAPGAPVGASSSLSSQQRQQRALGVAVCEQAARAIDLFAVKAENMIATGGDAVAMGAQPTSTQTRNVYIHNMLTQFHAMLVRELAALALDAECHAPLEEACGKLTALCDTILTPLFTAMRRHLEKMLLGMHQEDFGHAAVATGKSSDATPCSRYISDLQRRVGEVASEQLQMLKPSALLRTHKRALATRLLRFFVQHAAMVRPLEEAGKLKLAGDMAQLELAVAPLFQPIEELGGAYKALRALRPLVFTDSDHVFACPEVHALPLSVVVHLLCARGPPDLLLPHQRLGWSAAQYSDWLDVHSEEEAWGQVRASMDALEQLSRQRLAGAEYTLPKLCVLLLEHVPKLLRAQAAGK